MWREDAEHEIGFLTTISCRVEHSIPAITVKQKEVKFLHVTMSVCLSMLFVNLSCLSGLSFYYPFNRYLFIYLFIYLYLYLNIV